MRDFEDREIFTGDELAYAVKHSTFVSLTRAAVIDVERGRVKVQPNDKKRKPVWLCIPSTIAILDSITLR